MAQLLSAASLVSQLEDKDNVINMLKTDLTEATNRLTVRTAKSVLQNFSFNCWAQREGKKEAWAMQKKVEEQQLQIDTLMTKLSDLGNEKAVAENAANAAKLKALNAANEQAEAAEAARAQDAERVRLINTGVHMLQKMAVDQQVLITALKQVTAVKKTLIERLNEHSRESKLSQALLERLRQALEASQQENETLKQNASDATDNAAQIQKLYDALREKSVTNVEQSKLVQQEMAAMRIQIAALQKKANKEAEAKVDAAVKAAELRTNDLCQNAFLGQIEQLEQEKKGLLQKVEEAEKQRKTSDDQYMNVIQQKVAVQAKADAAAKAAEINVKGLCQQVATMRNTIEQLERENVEVKAAELHARRRFADAESNRQGLCGQAATMRTQVENLQKEKQGLLNQVELKQAALEKLENTEIAQEYYQQLETIRQLNLQKKQLEDQVQSIQFHHSERNKEVERLKTGMADKQSEIDALKEEVRKLTPPADFGLGVDSQDSVGTYYNSSDENLGGFASASSGSFDADVTNELTRPRLVQF